MAALTPLGKAVRKLRIDKEKTLSQMALVIGCSPAFLSAVETGRKAPPKGFAAKIASEFGLDIIQTEELIRLEELSMKEVTLNVENTNHGTRKVAVEFARRFTNLTPEQRDEILQILNNGV